MLHLLIVGGGKGGAKEPTVLTHAVPGRKAPREWEITACHRGDDEWSPLAPGTVMEQQEVCFPGCRDGCDSTVGCQLSGDHLEVCCLPGEPAEQRRQ